MRFLYLQDIHYLCLGRDNLHLWNEQAILVSSVMDWNQRAIEDEPPLQASSSPTPRIQIWPIG